MHTILYYLWHWLAAVNDHSLQAPFIYDFYSKVLKKKGYSEDIIALDQLRKDLVTSRATISVTSFGASSKVNNQKVRPIADIAKGGITKKATSLLLNRIIKYYSLTNIVELGTSFGLNTMFLAMDRQTRVDTFEGCPNTLDIAKANFAKLDYSNIKTIAGNIDQTLPGYLTEIDHSIDFAYIDANHRFAPTMKYFELLTKKVSSQSVLVFDDIHWSAEMSRAWQTIANDRRVTLSIDLFTLGIVFFRPELTKQHYRLRY